MSDLHSQNYEDYFIIFVFIIFFSFKFLMITQIFLLQLLLTFLIGSCWIYLTVLAGIRYGSKVGGFIGGLPSTALLSFFFIGFTQSPAIASSATTIFPVAIAITGLFMVVYASIVRRGFILALFVSLCFWFFLSGFVIFFHFQNFKLNLLIYLLVTLFDYILMEKFLMIKAVISDKENHSEKHLVLRSVSGGLVVMITVMIAKAGGPLMGGIFAAFPVMIISILTISYKTQGLEFSRAMTKPLMLTGMITIVVYIVALRYLYLYTGLYTGSFLSLCISGVSAFFTYKFILPRLI